MQSVTIRAAAVAVAMLALTSVAQAQQAVASTTALTSDARNVTGGDRTKGFMLGIHTIAAPGLTISGGDIDGDFATTFGAGAAVTVGYGITRMLGIFLSADVARQKTAPDDSPEGSWGLTHVQLGARANLPLGGSTIPYLTAGYGRRALAAKATTEDGETMDASVTGTMLAGGAGIEHFFSRTMAVDAGVDVGYGKLGHFTEGGESWDSEVNATTTIRARLGVTWRPGGRR